MNSANKTKMINNQQQRHILTIEDLNGTTTIVLEDQGYTLGRHSTNSIVINSQEVSRHHATLVQKISEENNISFWIIDGDGKGNMSQNGIFVNGKPCLEQQLKHGDNILLGTEVKASYQIIKSKIEFPPANLDNNATKKNEHNQEGESIRSNKEKLLKLAAFLESIPYPIIELDLLKRAITYINPAARIKFKNLLRDQLSHPLIKDILQYSNRQKNLFIREVKIGDEFFYLQEQYIPENKLLRIYVVEITKYKKNEAKLKHQASHDPVTNLPNRILFDKHLKIALANAKKNNHQMAVMFLNLEGFNENLSHAIKDQLLQNFARRLIVCLRIGDLAVRWESHEFALLLPQIIDPKEVVNISQKILYTLKLPLGMAGQQIKLGGTRNVEC